MQLNGAGGKGSDQGGGKSDGKWIQVSDDVLRGHAKTVREVLSTSFQKVDNAAMRETEQVPGSMKGFVSDEAFKEFQQMWRDQMAYLKKRYASVAKALDKAADNFKSTDAWTKEQVEKIARERREKESKPSLNDLLYPKQPMYRPGGPDLTTPQNPLYPNATQKPLYGPYPPTSAPTSTPTFEPNSWSEAGR
ncbi:WXG100 family type VII secretion target [Streptomyces sp. CA-250714]|uniref:WXG100 family type VII secretion target n=1 Tax=Streptomyces sp. CA-250714 TaxID=3240060 RepID=UPI003D8F2687